MKSWQEELLKVAGGTNCERRVFEKIVSMAASLGFEYCAYGLRMPLPLSNPRTVLFSNYPNGWRERYEDAGYLQIDPTVLHSRHSQSPLLWSDAMFQSAPQLWAEAQDHELRYGWAQSSRDANGVAGMLTLARSSEPIEAQELEQQEMKMRWLVNVAHLELSRLLAPKLGFDGIPALTQREIEVLKWTADGKTASEISELLSVSQHTINFHVKNVILKLSATNKTAAVVRAAMLGLLN